MSQAVAPSTTMVVHEDDRYLSFPAIVRVDKRLFIIFRAAWANELDLDATILICVSDDDGRTWSQPKTWVKIPGGDSRNCGGGQIGTDQAHFVYDVDYGETGGRHTFYRTIDGGGDWLAPIRLRADRAGDDRTSIGNRGIIWDEQGQTLFFPHFAGNSVVVDRASGRQTQTHRLPRLECTVAWNRRGDLIMFGLGGSVDVSRDRGRTWTVLGHIYTISQPDLLQLADRRLLLCYSDQKRVNEYLLVLEDGHDMGSDPIGVKIFEGTFDGVLNSRGKAMSLEHGDQMLTVLYEACGPRGPSRIYLVWTPRSCLQAGGGTGAA